MQKAKQEIQDLRISYKNKIGGVCKGRGYVCPEVVKSLSLGGSMLAFVLNLLFPPKCGFCGKIDKNFLCKKCEIELKEKRPESRIRKIEGEEFSYHAYAYYYKEEIRNKIIDYKFYDKPELSDTFVKLLLNDEKICGFLENYDIIIPVPMYPKKQRQRGYNQVALIAKKLAKALSIEYAEDVLQKSKQTQMQSSLTKQLRKINVKNAYNCINEQKIRKKRVVLLDDIYTTGSTAKECSKMLKQAGAREVAVFTFAKD